MRLYENSKKRAGRKIPHKPTFTFPTGADFEEASSQALFWADAEPLIGWVLLFAGQNGTWWREVIGRDSFYLYIFLKLHVD